MVSGSNSSKIHYPVLQSLAFLSCLLFVSPLHPLPFTHASELGQEEFSFLICGYLQGFKLNGWKNKI